MPRLEMEQIYRRLAALISPLGEEEIKVEQSLGRVTATDLRALRDQPAADEALRDGYALGPALPGQAQYQVVGEVAAGSLAAGRVSTGEAKRIFTGANLPAGTVRVVPFEALLEENDKIQVPAAALQQKRTFIRRRGQDVCQGDCLVPVGSELTSSLVESLAVAGILRLTARRCPQVLVCCTGSELVGTGDVPGSGQKVSSNGLLLSHLLPLYGAVVVDVQTREDELSALTELFLSFRNMDSQVLLTTGGLGPGKYDLVEKAFIQAGGEVWLRALPMRPGKAILVGSLAGRLVIGLPGPPTAVRALITELVGPALLLLQGGKHYRPAKLSAKYMGPPLAFHHDLTLVKSGHLLFAQGDCLVQALGSCGAGNCNVLLPGSVAELKEGDLLEVHPWREFLKLQ